MYLYMKWVESIDDSHFYQTIAFNRFTLMYGSVTCTAYVLHCRRLTRNKLTVCKLQ